MRRSFCLVNLAILLLGAACGGQTTSRSAPPTPSGPAAPVTQQAATAGAISSTTAPARTATAGPTAATAARTPSIPPATAVPTALPAAAAPSPATASQTAVVTATSAIPGRTVIATQPEERARADLARRLGIPPDQIEVVSVSREDNVPIGTLVCGPQGESQQPAPQGIAPAIKVVLHAGGKSYTYYVRGQWLIACDEPS